MRAMLLDHPAPIPIEPLREAEVPVPEPGAGQIRIRVTHCGVCRTDLHIVEGDLPPRKTPVIPGHQIVGTAEAVGPNVHRYRLGDRLGVAWLNWTCRRCQYCRASRENLCDEARFTGYQADGGYAQYAVIDEAFAYPIPDVFSDPEAAPLLCAGIIGYRSLRLSEIKPGQRLGLYGFGASAHIVIQVARHWGCEVSVFTRGEAHQRLARDLGAIWAGRAEETPPHPLDSAILFAPVGALVPEVLRTLRKGGTLAINAIHLSPIPPLDYTRLYHERTIRSVTNFTRQDAEDLLRLSAEVPVRTAVEIFPLREANRALQLLKAAQLRGAAVLEIP
ncbi:MAG: zinc-dependent alcohol dehydrogenase family protein [Candidatus Methylomirabilales bacterium]|nr:zinc-dependent alcohol dehydrogenase family protein [candidate division NC10 bacterium]MCZ6550194.1 zinc-dependent alcohol dehydrogenase family protein [candidate division NC10 bacterium]